MNRKLQNENEMQDDELYALLDSAMADDRLCVSEDLIQRTLQKVKEEKKPVTVTKRKPGYRALVQYAGLAAAALLIVFVGSNAIKNVNKESASDMAEPRAGAWETGDNNKHYYSTADSVDGTCIPNAESPMTDGGNDVVSDETAYSHNAGADPMERDTPKDAEDATEAYFGSEDLFLSDQLQSLLKEKGYDLFGKSAECWDYAGEADDVETQITNALLNGTVIEGLSTIGSYRYEIVDGEGNREIIVSDFPIDRIIRIPATTGDLWFLLGAETMFFLE